MERVEAVVRSFGGHQYRACYRDLCWLIDVEKDYQPDPPKMKVLVVEASRRAKRGSPNAMWRSAARAVEDLWENGDMESLFAFQRCWRRYRPKPQEFIQVVSWRLWQEERKHG